MENASKALIIAGAILIAILLIAVGMVVFNSARGTIDESIAQLSSQEIQMFNQQWTQYRGDRVSGSIVLTIQDKVKANNIIYPDGQKKITINAPTIKIANFYKVEVTTNEQGLVDVINVTEVL